MKIENNQGKKKDLSDLELRSYAPSTATSNKRPSNATSIRSTTRTDRRPSTSRGGTRGTRDHHFPDLTHWDPVPGVDSDLSEIESDDESAIQDRKKKYTSKVDQDVAVFLQLAEQMSMESLIFLLEGQARVAQQQFPLQPKQKQGITSTTRSTLKSKSLKEEPQQKKTTQLPSLKKVKCFRFAEVSNNEVRAVVYEIEPITEYKDDLWWQADEMRAFRKDAIETVRFYSKFCLDYVNAVEDVFVAGENNHKVQRQIKKLASESYVRGFEAHIVSMLSERRDLFCRAILALQDELAHQPYNISSQTIGDASEKHSKLAADFAVRLAQIDHVEALKANISKS